MENLNETEHTTPENSNVKEAIASPQELSNVINTEAEKNASITFVPPDSISSKTSEDRLDDAKSKQNQEILNSSLESEDMESLRLSPCTSPEMESLHISPTNQLSSDLSPMRKSPNVCETLSDKNQVPMTSIPSEIDSGTVHLNYEHKQILPSENIGNTLSDKAKNNDFVERMDVDEEISIVKGMPNGSDEEKESEVEPNSDEFKENENGTSELLEIEEEKSKTGLEANILNENKMIEDVIEPNITDKTEIKKDVLDLKSLDTNLDEVKDIEKLVGESSKINEDNLKIDSTSKVSNEKKINEEIIGNSKSSESYLDEIEYIDMACLSSEIDKNNSEADCESNILDENEINEDLILGSEDSNSMLDDPKNIDVTCESSGINEVNLKTGCDLNSLENNKIDKDVMFGLKESRSNFDGNDDVGMACERSEIDEVISKTNPESNTSSENKVNEEIILSSKDLEINSVEINVNMESEPSKIVEIGSKTGFGLNISNENKVNEEVDLESNSLESNVDKIINVNEFNSKINLELIDSNISEATGKAILGSPNGDDEEKKISDKEATTAFLCIEPETLERAEETLLSNSEPQGTLEQSLEHSTNLLSTTTEINESSTHIENEKTASMDIIESIREVQPSTSTGESVEDMLKPIDPDTSDEIPEVNDSLGLLAESSRTVEEDEDQEEEDDDEDDDEQDEEINLMGIDYSEDSSAHHSEDNRECEAHFSPDTNQENTNSFEDLIDNVPNETQLMEQEKLELKITGVAGGISQQLGYPKITDESKAIGPVPVEAVVQQAEPVSEQVEEQAAEKSSSEPMAEAGAEKITESGSPESLAKSPDSSGTKSPDPDEEERPRKKPKLEMIKPKDHILNVVELEGSSSEDDIHVSEKQPAEKVSTEVLSSDKNKDLSANEQSKTSVNLPKEIDVMSTSSGSTSDIVENAEETVISGIPKPKPSAQKRTRLNTSEVSIKTVASPPEPTLTIPEAKTPDVKVEGSPPTKEKKSQPPKFSLEVFNLDSDDEDTKKTATALTSADTIPSPPKTLTAVEIQSARDTSSCVNYMCTSGSRADMTYHRAPGFVLDYFEVKRKKKCDYVCADCFQKVAKRLEGLIEGVRDMTPLMELDVEKECQELVEISDSDSESDADEPVVDPAEKLGEKCAKFLEEHLANVLNETWHKYKIEERLETAKAELEEELSTLEKKFTEIDNMLTDVQVNTDKLRNDLYATFAEPSKQLEPIEIVDVPEPQSATDYYGDVSSDNEDVEMITEDENKETDDRAVAQNTENKELDDNADIAVVKLSAESAPASLPPTGELERPSPKVGDTVYVLRHNFGTWTKAKLTEVVVKNGNPAAGSFSIYKVRLESKLKGQLLRQVSGRHLAYAEPANVRLTIGTRVIALFTDTVNTMKRESYYSGIVAEIPTPVNNFRYLVFFDDGYAQYVQHADTRVVCEGSARIWEDVHPDSREFVRKYLLAYPERPMVRLHAGQSLKTEWNGKWWMSRVVSVDASLVHVYFEADDRSEWIYRGSTRLAPLFLELQAAGRRSQQNQRPRTIMRSKKTQAVMNDSPYVEYLRSDGQENRVQQLNEENRRQRSVAKKSTSVSSAPHHPHQPQQAMAPIDNIVSRVVYYTPKAAVRPYKMTAHVCGPRCKRTDVLPLKELKTYNPLARPLLSGWERHVLRFKGRKVVMYRAPCGRRLRNIVELHRYLSTVGSDMSVDLFDYAPSTHCLAEFVLNRCNISKKDLSHGKESVPVPCVNYYDNSLPDFCSYSTERTPTAGVPLNTDPDFLCGCDCTDDCQDKSKCACWKMTLEGARTIGMEGDDVGYVYKRLLQPLISGIYECNSRCKCRNTCLNRVVQHPLQLKLQVFKTLNRGWGIRALNDIPRGSFLCIYAGNLLTDATANVDGINEGDEYLAELDYIEVLEKLKEGYESDVPEKDRKSDRKQRSNSKSSEEEEEEEAESSEDERNEEEDAEFRPCVYLGPLGQSKKQLRKREKKRDAATEQEKKRDEFDTDKDREQEKPKEMIVTEDDCITISDDEEVREPSRFTAQAELDDDDYVSKYRSVRSYFGKDESCYIMDAKVQGNIGRYLNHSCSPNVFVQNVFVDTHDPRFPWVAFFASSHIRAGTELTWNYNYDVGSVPDKVMYCRCGAPNCRGRLL